MAQVADKLHISATSVQTYLIRENIKRRSISDGVNSSYFTRFHKQAYKLKDNLTDKQNQLKVAGIMLYWGEGTKGNGSVRFANSDPDMIKLFLVFLRTVCGIHEDRLTALIHYYPDQDIVDLRKFWISITHIHEKRFNREYMHIGKTGTYKKKSVYGTLALSYCDKKLLNQLVSWIDEYRKMV